MSNMNNLTIASHTHLLIGLCWSNSDVESTSLELSMECLFLARNNANNALCPIDLVDENVGEDLFIRPDMQNIFKKKILLDLDAWEGAVSALAISVTDRRGPGTRFRNLKEIVVCVMNYETNDILAQIDLIGNQTRATGVVVCLLEQGNPGEQWILKISMENFAAQSARWAHCSLWEGVLGPVNQDSSSTRATYLEQRQVAILKAAERRARSTPDPPPSPADRTIRDSEQVGDVEARRTPGSTIFPADATSASTPAWSAVPRAPASVEAKVNTGTSTPCPKPEAVPLSLQTGVVEVSLTAALNLSATCFNSLGTLVDTVYFNQHSVVEGAVVHCGDSHSGEVIRVSLDDLRSVHVIVFVASRHCESDAAAASENTTKCTVKHDTREISCADMDMAELSSMVMCMLFRYQHRWYFADIHRPCRNRMFFECLMVIQGAVNEVIDPALIEERGNMLTPERSLYMHRCNNATVPRNIHRLKVGLGWQSQAGKKVVLDLSCLMLVRAEDGQFTPYDMVSTNHQCLVRPGVQHLGDSTSGHSDPQEKELILVDLPTIEGAVDALAFVATIQHAEHSFKLVEESCVRIMNQDASHVYATFRLGANLAKNAVVLFLLQRGRTPTQPWTLLTVGEDALHSSKTARYFMSRLWKGYFAEEFQKRSTVEAQPIVAALHASESSPADVAPAHAAHALSFLIDQADFTCETIEDGSARSSLVINFAEKLRENLHALQQAQSQLAQLMHDRQANESAMEEDSKQVRSSLRSLAQASPLVIDCLKRFGASFAQAEQERGRIQNDPIVYEYYLFFLQSISSAVLACQTIASGFVDDARATNAEQIMGGIEIAAQAVSWTGAPLVPAILKFLLGLANNIDRQRTIRRIITYFPSLDGHKYIEILARELTILIWEDIHTVLREATEAPKRSLLDSGMRMVEWMKTSTNLSVIQRYACGHASLLMDHLMSSKEPFVVEYCHVPVLIEWATGLDKESIESRRGDHLNSVSNNNLSASSSTTREDLSAASTPVTGNGTSAEKGTADERMLHVEKDIATLKMQQTKIMGSVNQIISGGAPGGLVNAQSAKQSHKPLGEILTQQAQWQDEHAAVIREMSMRMELLVEDNNLHSPVRVEVGGGNRYRAVNRPDEGPAPSSSPHPSSSSLHDQLVITPSALPVSPGNRGISNSGSSGSSSSRTQHAESDRSSTKGQSETQSNSSANVHPVLGTDSNPLGAGGCCVLS